MGRLETAKRRPEASQAATTGADLPVQRVGSLFALPALIREVGVDPGTMLDAVGLAPDALDSPENWVSYPALGRLLGVVAAAADCPHFGLLAGQLFHLAHQGVVGQVVRHSTTVREGLRAFMLHQHLNSSGGLVFLIERGPVVDFGYAIYHPGLAPLRPIYDCVIAYCFRTLRELAGPGFVPAEAFIPYSRPADDRLHRNLLKVHPHYDAEMCALRFPARWLDRPVEGADPEIRRVAVREVEHAARADLRERVYRALRLLMLHGRSSGDDVADFLAMHRRTLNRRLKSIGLTFQQVLDEVRFEAARQLLSESALPLDDIAATLGYAGVSPFMRTFRRWTGTTPDRWRRAMHQRGEAPMLHGPIPVPPLSPALDRSDRSPSLG